MVTTLETNDRRVKTGCRALFSAVTFIVGWSVYTRVLVPGGDFGWDEAAHAMRGLVIADDLKQSNWLGFLYDTYRQVYWPPLHSWLSGIIFLIGEPSVMTARIVSLLSFVAAALVMYVTALQITRQRNELAAISAGTLFLTSPSLVSLAGQSMLEIPALLFLTLAFLVYIRFSHAETFSPGRSCLLGLAITATYFIKSNYGILLFLAIFVNELIEADFCPKRLWTRNHLYAVLPMLIAFAIWFAYPPKIIGTWNMLINRSETADRFSIDAFLFYPTAFVRLSGSVWIFMLLLLALAVALRLWHEKNIRFLVILVAIQFLIGQLHHTKADRHLLPALVASFLLAGYFLAQLCNSAWQTGTRMRLWGSMLAMVIVVWSAVNIFVDALRPSSKRDNVDAIPSIVAAALENNKSLLLGSMDLYNPSPPGLDWHLAVDHKVMNASQSGVTIDWEVVQTLAAELKDPSVPGWVRKTILPLLDGDQTSRKIRSLYLGLPSHATYSRSAEGLTRFLKIMVDNDPFDRAIVVTSLVPNARYRLAFIEPALHEIGFYSISTEKFASANVRVDVYRRTASAGG